MGSAIVVRELDLVHAGREQLDNRTHLSLSESLARQIIDQRNDIQYLQLAVHLASQLTMVKTNA